MTKGIMHSLATYLHRAEEVSKDKHLHENVLKMRTSGAWRISNALSLEPVLDVKCLCFRDNKICQVKTRWGIYYKASDINGTPSSRFVYV